MNPHLKLVFPDLHRQPLQSHAFAAAAEAMSGLDRLNADRARMGKPTVIVDLALHLGEVLYGNVGATDRLDFTVIGPAVKLCTSAISLRLTEGNRRNGSSTRPEG